MFFRLHPRRQPSWEVVGFRDVQPVYNGDSDYEVSEISAHDVSGSYSFDFDTTQRARPTLEEQRAAVSFARGQLLRQIQDGELCASKRYNVLLREGWTLTLLKREDAYRMEVHYTGRPAVARGEVKLAPPPFLQTLEDY